MTKEKNAYVEYRYDVDNIMPFMLRSIGVRPQNPLVEFYKSEESNLYFIRIIAIIPSQIEEIFVSPPEARQKVHTLLEYIDTRIITIKWEENIPPDAPSTFNLWSIDLEYSILDEKNGDDKAIKVVFEYDVKNGDNGDIDTKLSRGTVTTSGTPPASDP